MSYNEQARKWGFAPIPESQAPPQAPLEWMKRNFQLMEAVEAELRRRKGPTAKTDPGPQWAQQQPNARLRQMRRDIAAVNMQNQMEANEASAAGTLQVETPQPGKPYIDFRRYSDGGGEIASVIQRGPVTAKAFNVAFGTDRKTTNRNGVRSDSALVVGGKGSLGSIGYDDGNFRAGISLPNATLAGEADVQTIETGWGNIPVGVRGKATAEANLFNGNAGLREVVPVSDIPAYMAFGPLGYRFLKKYRGNDTKSSDEWCAIIEGDADAGLGVGGSAGGELGLQKDGSVSVGANGKLFGMQLGGAVRLAPPEVCYPKKTEMSSKREEGGNNNSSGWENQSSPFYGAEITPVLPQRKGAEAFTQVYPLSSGLRESAQADDPELPLDPPPMSVVGDKVFIGGDPRDPSRWMTREYPYTGGGF